MMLSKLVVRGAGRARSGALAIHGHGGVETEENLAHGLIGVIESGNAHCRHEHVQLVLHLDEGVRAFTEHRYPEWRGN